MVKYAGYGWSCEVATQALELGSVAAIDEALGVHVDSAHFGDELRFLPGRRRGRWPDQPEHGLPRVLSEQLSAGGGCAVAGGKHGLLIREVVVVGAVTALAVVVEEAPSLVQHALDAPCDPLGDRVHVGQGRLGQRMEGETAVILL